MLKQYEQHMLAAGRSRRTIDLRLYYLRRAERELGPLDMLITNDLLTWLAGQHWKPDTRRSARSALLSFYSWAAEYEVLDRNPAARLPTVRVPPGVPRPAPTSVLQKALDGATDREWLMLGLGAFAGMRRSEIAALPWSSVTWHGLRITGKGGRTRMVPLLPELADKLDAEHARRETGGWGSGWRFGFDPASPWVFPSPIPGEHVGHDNVGRTLARLLGPGLSAHTLRHRFATKIYAVDRDLLTCQQLMGHSRPETTARYTAVPQGAAMAAVMGTAA